MFTPLAAIPEFKEKRLHLFPSSTRELGNVNDCEGRTSSKRLVEDSQQSDWKIISHDDAQDFLGSDAIKAIGAYIVDLEPLQ